MCVSLNICVYPNMYVSMSLNICVFLDIYMCAYM